MRVVKDFTTPKPGLHNLAMNIRYMGQDLMNPPTVEGWHTGGEWIDSGTLVERINFAADQVGNLELPGVQEMVDRVGSVGTITAEAVVDRCLELLGAYELAEGTREQLIEHVSRGGDLIPALPTSPSGWDRPCNLSFPPRSTNSPSKPRRAQICSNSLRRRRNDFDKERPGAGCPAAVRG